MNYLEQIRKQYAETRQNQKVSQHNKTSFPFRTKAFGGSVGVSKKGYVDIGGKTFFARSTWEANIGAYLQLLKTQGHIKDWEHEPETFWFEGIRRGVCSYKPDFKVFKHDGTFYFEEVKGYMDRKSATKLKRMKKYHPSIEVRVIDKARYKTIEKNSFAIPNWGKLL